MTAGVAYRPQVADGKEGAIDGLVLGCTEGINVGITVGFDGR